METAIFERKFVSNLRPNWKNETPIVGENLRRLIMEAKETTQRPKDYYQAWHNMLEYRSTGIEVLGSPNLTLSEGLHLFFMGASNKQVEDNYHLFLNIVVPPRKKQ